MSLPAQLHLGAVHLTVTDLDRSVAFYQDALGLQVHRRQDPVAALGTGEEDVLVLTEDPVAARAGRHAGLYHYALLYPSREELARAALRLGATQTPIDGASDHGTHEAFYLSDPDGNGIELAADRPREQWPDVRSVAGYAGGPQPLDISGLLGVVAGEQPRRHAGPGLRTGHLHLHVGDVEQGLAFYRDVLGFELMVNLGSAAFVSAGGYHHHLGFNVWRGEGVGPAPEHTVGLRHWTVELPTTDDISAVRERVAAAGIDATKHGDDGGFTVADPWGTRVAFAVRAPAAGRTPTGDASDSVAA